MKCKNLLTSLPLIAAVLYNPMASAVDTKVYNGSYCKPYFGSQSADLHHRYDGILNVSNNSRYITCPVLHDQAFVPQGAKIYVRYVAGSSGGTLSCTVYSLNSNGGIVASATGSTNQSGWLPPDNGQQPQPALVIGSDDASYNMFCSLPAGGRVSAIQVDEND